MSNAIETAIDVHGYTNGGEQVTVRLVLDRPCRDCRGDGLIQSSEWAEYFERGATGEEPAEPEELPCGECEGAGSVPTQQGAALLRFLRRASA